MKLVLQIAGGIILALVILVGGTAAIMSGINNRAERMLQEAREHESQKFNYERDCEEGEWVVDCIMRPYNGG